MYEKRVSLVIHHQPSVVIVTQCLRDHAFQGNTDVTENTCLHGNVLANVNVESVLVIQATLPAILYELPVPVLGALGVVNPPYDQFDTLFMRWIPFNAAEADYLSIFTARKRSKVMFPQASVYRGGGHMWPLPMIHLTPSPDNTHGTPRTPDMETTPHTMLLTSSGLCYWHLVIISGDLFKLVH